MNIPEQMIQEAEQKEIDTQLQLNAIHDDMVRACGVSFDLKDKKRPIVNFLGVFSELLKYTNGFAAAENDFLEKYSNGIVTENKFIIHDYFNKTHIPHSTFKSTEINLSVIAFIYNITCIIENKYNVAFSEDEMKKIINITFDNPNALDASLALYKNKFPVKPEFISNDQLSDDLKNSYPGWSQYLKESTNANSYIDLILFNSQEVNNLEHPFSKLKSLIVEPNIHHDILTNFEDFKYRAYHCESPDNITILFNSLKSMTHQTLNDSHNLDDFLNNMNKNFTPCLLTLEDKPFNIALNNFKSQLEDSHKEYLIGYNKELINNVRQEIAVNMVNYNDYGVNISDYQRTELIKIITDFSPISNSRDNPFISIIPNKNKIPEVVNVTQQAEKSKLKM